MDHLKRFTDAQETKYTQALAEINAGRKQSHWMWYIFPQIAGLGHSETAVQFAIQDREEASDYLQHPVLGARLIEISKALLNIQGRSANEIFGKPDDAKLRSCMSLFNILENTNPVFKEVLNKYFEGIGDERTKEILKEL